MCVRITLRDAARTGDTVAVTLPVGSANVPVAVYRLDAHNRREPLALGGAVASRDPDTGDVTLRLMTPEQGQRTSVEIVRR